MHQYRYLYLVFIFSIQLLNAGCASTPDTLPLPENTEALTPIKNNIDSLSGENLVAINLANALAQLNELHPNQTPLRVSQPGNAFESHLYRALADAGFQLYSDGPDKRIATIKSIVKTNNSIVPKGSSGQGRTYLLEVNNIKIKRDYLFEGNHVKPRSHMYLKGTDSSGIKLNDTIFNQDSADKALAASNRTGANSHTHKTKASYETTAQATKTEQAEKVSLPMASLEKQSKPKLPQTPSIAIRADAGSGTAFSEGDTINLSIDSTQDARVYCYYQDGLGSIARLFPNRYRQDNTVRAGQTLSLPESDAWQLTATRSGKTESFLCIATNPDLSERFTSFNEQPDLQPLPFDSLQQIYNLYSAVGGVKLANHSISFRVD